MEIQKQFKYIYEILTISISQYDLLKKMYADFDSESQTKELQIILIDALVNSLIVNITKITRETRENKITIFKLVNEYNKKYPKKMINRKKQLKPNGEIDRISTYRNSIVAHSNIGNLSDDFKGEYKVMFGDFEKVLDYIHETLFVMSSSINEYSIGGRDTKTGELFNTVLNAVRIQYSICQNKYYQYNLMFGFLSEYHKEYLLNVINQKKPNLEENK